MGKTRATEAQPRAQTALASSPIYDLRELQVEQRNGSLVISGRVSSFYHKQLAQEVQRVARSMGFKADISTVENPRKEAEEHYYNPAHTGLLELGLEPHYLTGDVLSQMLETVIQYKENIREEAIFRGVKWK